MAPANDDPSTWTWVLIGLAREDLAKRCRSSKQADADLVRWIRNGLLPWSCHELNGAIGDAELWNVDLQARLGDNWAASTTRRAGTVVHSPYMDDGDGDRVPQRPIPSKPRRMFTRVVVAWEKYVELRNAWVTVPAELMAPAVTQEPEAVVITQPRTPDATTGSTFQRGQRDRIVSVLTKMYPEDNIPIRVKPGDILVEVNAKLREEHGKDGFRVVRRDALRNAIKKLNSARSKKRR